MDAAIDALGDFEVGVRELEQALLPRLSPEPGQRKFLDARGEVMPEAKR